MSHQALQNYGLWELAVLSLLQEGPTHPYEILRLLKARHKDDVLVLKRGSLYHAIRRLEAAGLIKPREITREGRRPERITYAITPRGKQAHAEWLQHLIATPRHERSDFMGALSFLTYLTPAESAAGLQRRVASLEQEIARLDAVLAEARPRIGRIHVIETEYARALRVAELEWTRGVIAELRAHRFTWDLKAILRQIRTSAAAAHRRKQTRR